MKEPKKWLTALMGLGLLYLIFSGNRGLWNLYKLQTEKQVLSDQVYQLKTEIDRYQSEYQTFEKNPSVLEKQAREELNLVRPGEIIYKFKTIHQP